MLFGALYLVTGHFLMDKSHENLQTFSPIYMGFLIIFIAYEYPVTTSVPRYTKPQLESNSFQY